ncbi:hypothetical protein [Aurantiacibacter xanthus]|nr:hypothetical protein [Aurantiacibacter xanthus]
MDTKDMLDIIQTVVGPNNAARLMNTGTRGLELRGPGAVAHMSLHLKSTMSKNHQTQKRTAIGSPIFTGGAGYPSNLATVADAPVETVSAASVEPI